MKPWTLNTVFVLAVCCSLIVQAQQQRCKCGGLGSGTNPCTCSETLVKAAKLPKPTYYASPQQINDAAVARNNIIVAPVATQAQAGCSNSQTVSNSESIVYSNSNSNSYASSNSNAYSDSDSSASSASLASSACSGNSGSSGSSSNAYGITESGAYSGDNANAYNSDESIVYSKSDSTAYGSSSSSSGSSVVYNDAAVPVADASSSSTSGCGCQKQNVEALEIDVPTNSNGNIVPRFPPVGDLCYPLDIDSRTGKLIEKATVIPANPGKIVCNSCNPLAPYEVCVNAQTGETTSRALVSSFPAASSGSASIIFGKSNVGASSGTTSGNFNSGIFAASRSGTYGNSNFGSVGFGRPSSGVYSLPRLLYSAAGSNAARGQTQYSEITRGGSFSDCDDDRDEIDVDSYPEVPADAVSLTLAYKNLRAPNVIYRQGKQFVPEDKLSFGHRTVPNDAKYDRKLADIAEEKLVTVEKPVVELKIAPPRTVLMGSYNEREEAKLAELEAIERESITREENADQVAESLLTYRDLGYAPVGSIFAKSRRYDGIINGEINDSSEQPCGPLGPPIPDYVPGSVVVQQELIGNLPASPLTATAGDINQSVEIQSVQANPSPRFGFYKQRFYE